MKTVSIVIVWGMLCAGPGLAGPSAHAPSGATSRAGQDRDTEPAFRPTFGLWYTVWWTKGDQFRHWSNCHRLPTRGPYSAGDPEIIRVHYAQFRELGVDFPIMDDTNCAGNDGRRINDNIRAWFDFMDARPVPERILICIGGGGEMRASRRAGPRRAAIILVPDEVLGRLRSELR